MKRMLSVLMTLVLVFGLFATICVTASAEETLIEELEATVTGYEIGKSTADVVVTAPEGVNYQVVIKEWMIYDYAEGDYEPYTGVLEDGKLYQALINFIPDEGFEISGACSCWINGEWGEEMTMYKGVLSAGYFVNYTQRIDTVELTGIPVAEIGAALPFTGISIPADAPYTLESVEWNDTDWNDLPEGTKAEDGEAYYQFLYLKAKEGYSFSENVKVSVNGKAPDYDYNDTAELEIQLYHTFRTQIASVEVTGLDKPVAGQTPDTTVTAKLDGKDAPATVYWYDENGDLVTQFAEKGIYEVEIEVQIPAGYEVPWEVPFMLDGKMISMGMGDTAVYGRKTFALGYPVLDKVELTTQGFAEGKNSADAKVTAKDLKVLEAIWGIGDLTTGEIFEGKFENGKKYLLVTILELPEDTFIDDTTKVYLNGQLQKDTVIEYMEGLAAVYVQDLDLKQPATPATGDNTPVVALVAVMALSAAMLVALPVARKRKEN